MDYRRLSLSNKPSTWAYRKLDTAKVFHYVVITNRCVDSLMR